VAAPALDELQEHLVGHLGEASYRAAVERAEQMSPEEATAFALDTGPIG
jgi:hypothetical protein